MMQAVRNGKDKMVQLKELEVQVTGTVNNFHSK